jgi:hypothetical protein
MSESAISVVQPVFIDLSADPFIPRAWSVAEHIPGGMIDWSREEPQLYIDEEQKGRVVHGEILLERIRPFGPYNANLLDFFLRDGNRRFIPQEWVGKTVFFWGTKYLNHEKKSVVRYLYWDTRGVPCAGHLRIERGCGCSDFAVVSSI